MLGRLALGRVALAGAVAAAGLVAGVPAASADQGPRCRVVWDPKTIMTPAGPVSYPHPYVYCT